MFSVHYETTYGCADVDIHASSCDEAMEKFHHIWEVVFGSNEPVRIFVVQRIS